MDEHLLLRFKGTIDCSAQDQVGDTSDVATIREEVGALQQEQESIIEQINLLARRIDAISGLANPGNDKVIRRGAPPAHDKNAISALRVIF
jgi:hypothetical protein